MSRFNDVPWSKEYAAAVQAIENLKCTNAEDIDRACAEVSVGMREAEMAERLKAKRSNRHACVYRMTGRKCPVKGYYERPGGCIPPASDHTDAWIRNNRIVAITTQPYSYDVDDMAELIKWCEENGVTSQITAWESWHYPGHTVCITIRKAQE